MDRREYEMTPEQLTTLLDACKPVPYIVIGGVEPRSPQQNANDAWQRLARELHFKWDSVMSVQGKPPQFFTAVPSDA